MQSSSRCLHRLRPIYAIQHRLPPPRHASIRPFTHNTALFLLATHQPRPQLPFLHHSLRRLPHHESQRLRAHLARLLTTETRRFLKKQLYSATRYTLYLWAFVGLAAALGFGVSNALLERKYPSPPDWSFVSRWNYRVARAQEDPTGSQRGLINWSSTGQWYGDVLARLENEQLDGQGLTPALGAEEGALYVEGVGATGLCIESKPDAWRRGYYDVLRGNARVAEHLDTWLRERRRRIAFPPDVVIGPDNPHPRPVPLGAAEAPRAEDCEPAFASPHVFYGKILTTRGFDARQKVEAALAYASWLDFKGLTESAAEVHRWALDLAAEGASAAGVTGVVERASGAVPAQAPGVTENVVHAVMGWGQHQARTGELVAALATYASLLRALRALPPTPQAAAPSPPPPSRPPSQDSLLGPLPTWLSPPAFPDAPPSGNDLLTRTPDTSCTEAGIMAHVGEILFASSTPSSGDSFYSSPSSPSPSSPSATPTAAQSAGLAWTRDAVTLAESTLLSLGLSDQPSQPSPDAAASTAAATDATQRCAECLAAGMKNWEHMVARLKQSEEASAAAVVAEEKNEPLGKTVSARRDWRSWIWRPDNYDDEDEGGNAGKRRWAAEAERVAERTAEMRLMLRNGGFDANGERVVVDGEGGGGGGAGWFF